MLEVRNMLKNHLPILIVIVCLFSSCSTFKPAVSKPAATSSTATTQSNGNVQFISNISIKPDGREDRTHSSISTVSSNASNSKTAGYSDRANVIENLPALQFKYAILENCSVEDLSNPKLLSFMDYWYGTPYRYGGTTRDGIVR